MSNYLLTMRHLLFQEDEDTEGEGEDMDEDVRFSFASSKVKNLNGKRLKESLVIRLYEFIKFTPVCYLHNCKYSRSSRDCHSHCTLSPLENGYKLLYKLAFTGSLTLSGHYHSADIFEGQDLDQLLSLCKRTPQIIKLNLIHCLFNK